jgi:hypothetical protein
MASLIAFDFDRPVLLMADISRLIREDVDNIYDLEPPDLERYWLTLSSWMSSGQYPAYRS